MIEPIISFSCPEDDIADGCKTAKSCIYPDPSDSNGFLQCDDSGQVYHQKCNPSLVWNDKIKNCDAPRRRPSARKTTEPPVARDKKRPAPRDQERPTFPDQERPASRDKKRPAPRDQERPTFPDQDQERPAPRDQDKKRPTSRTRKPSIDEFL